MSEQKRDSAHAELYRIQQTLNAPKNQFNSFGKYKYRSCEAILEAVKKLLPEKATVTITDELVLIGERYYVKALASFNFNGECITAAAYAREPLEKKGYDASQVTGSTSSYARKYALNGLFSIDDAKDSDVTNEESSNEVIPQRGLNTPLRTEMLYDTTAKQLADSSNAAFGFTQTLIKIKSAIKMNEAEKVMTLLLEIPEKHKGAIWKSLTPEEKGWINLTTRQGKQDHGGN